MRDGRIHTKYQMAFNKNDVCVSEVQWKLLLIEIQLCNESSVFGVKGQLV